MDAISKSEAFWLKALDSGVSWVILLLVTISVLSLFVWGVRALFTRLFDADKGLVTVYVSSQRELAEKLSDASVRHAKAAERTNRAVQKTSQMTADGLTVGKRSAERIDDLIEVAKDGCIILKKMSARLDLNITEEIETIEDRLEVRSLEAAKTVEDAA